MRLSPDHKNENNKSLACKLHKAIYSLKQSPCAWYEKLSHALLEFGFCKSSADSSMFVKLIKNTTTIVLIYIDDLIITGNNEGKIRLIKHHLKNKFDIKDLGELQYYLGIELAYSKKGLFLSQRKYMIDLLKETRKLGVKPTNISMEANKKLNIE